MTVDSLSLNFLSLLQRGELPDEYGYQVGGMAAMSHAVSRGLRARMVSVVFDAFCVDGEGRVAGLPGSRAGMAGRRCGLPANWAPSPGR